MKSGFDGTPAAADAQSGTAAPAAVSAVTPAAADAQSGKVTPAAADAQSGRVTPDTVQSAAPAAVPAVTVRIRTERGASLPRYETDGSAGMDLRARVDEPVVLAPMQRALIPTGVYIELPPGYEAQVRSRSGLSVRSGIACVNGVGTVDSDYRGELLVPVVNLGDEAYAINDGDRVAQMVVARYERVEWEAADRLGETERGAGGFGHTGV